MDTQLVVTSTIPGYPPDHSGCTERIVKAMSTDVALSAHERMSGNPSFEGEPVMHRLSTTRVFHVIFIIVVAITSNLAARTNGSS